MFIIIVTVRYASCQQIDDGNICSKHPNNVIVANPYDCYSFYACQHGNALKIVCPNNSIFNPKLGNCDPNHLECIVEEEEDATLSVVNDKKDMSYERDETNSEDISNTGTETTEIMSSTSFPPTTTNLPTDATQTNSVTSTTEDPFNCETCPKPVPPYYVQCPDTDTENPSFLASDSFCDSFYLCYHGSPYEMFCPIGFFWNQEVKECILERQSNCTDASMWSNVPKCPLNGQYFFPHTERCNYFYYCENGIRSIQQCTAFKQWDIIEQTCKLDVKARCIKTIPRSQRAKYYTL